MGRKTKLTIVGDRFLLNEKLTYSEVPDCPYRGMLMNARFIQGIFDDASGVGRYQRFGRNFEAEENTNRLIEALEEWHKMGLRAFTVGVQGGGACFTIPSSSIRNNPFSEDGRNVDERYLERLNRLIEAADEIGMVVIVNFFYTAQCHEFVDDAAIRKATETMAGWLREKGYTNVIIDLANEQNDKGFADREILYTEDGIVELMDIARKASGGMPVGCSLQGGTYSDKIAQASDVIIVHGNSTSRTRLFSLLRRAKSVSPKRPVLVNEDSQAITQMAPAFFQKVSWGYYNNMTKQEPPADWGITQGYDFFFAERMQEYLTGKKSSLPKEQQFYLQGLEVEMEYEGKRYIGLAALYPEKIDYVEFFRDGKWCGIVYDDPFTLNWGTNWFQGAVSDVKSGETWKAVVHLTDESVLELEQTVV